jgi:hypothetical protein
MHPQDECNSKLATGTAPKLSSNRVPEPFVESFPARLTLKADIRPNKETQPATNSIPMIARLLQILIVTKFHFVDVRKLQ